MRHDEPRIQAACVRYFACRYRKLLPLFFSVPNGARVGETQRIVLKAEGLRSGVSDMILLVPSAHHHALCLEFKTPQGRQSETQKEFQLAAQEQGFRYEIIRSLNQFIEVVDGYLKDR